MPSRIRLRHILVGVLVAICCGLLTPGASTAHAAAPTHAFNYVVVARGTQSAFTPHTEITQRRGPAATST